MQESFFYHSFPRRALDGPSEIETGCKILSLIRDVGLLLTPEILKWQYPHADGTPPRSHEILQQRVCFTELPPAELAGHAREFGHFALEFGIDTLKGLGAMPVFYIPQPGNQTDELAWLGSTLVMQVIDAMVLTMRLAGVQECLDESPPIVDGRMKHQFGFTKPMWFSLDIAETRRVLEAFAYGLTPPKELEDALAGLLNLFYPADDIPRNKFLAYYRQREWRIARNFAVRNVEAMWLPSTELIDHLLKIDSEFYAKEFPPSSGKRRADGTFVCPGIGGKRIIEMVRRVIVPNEAVERAKVILIGLNNPPSVVAFDAR